MILEVEINHEEEMNEQFHLKTIQEEKISNSQNTIALLQDLLIVILMIDIVEMDNKRLMLMIDMIDEMIEIWGTIEDKVQELEIDDLIREEIIEEIHEMIDELMIEILEEMSEGMIVEKKEEMIEETFEEMIDEI